MISRENLKGYDNMIHDHKRIITQASSGTADNNVDEVAN